ncbi:unnamed protein product, partial [marine sediment metagenome]
LIYALAEQYRADHAILWVLAGIEIPFDAADFAVQARVLYRQT